MKIDAGECANHAIEELCQMVPDFGRWWRNNKDLHEEFLETLSDEFAVCAETAVCDGSPESEAAMVEKAERLLEEVKDTAAEAKRRREEGR